MFVKETKVKRSGREYSYLQLVEGYRDENGKVRHRVVANLGRKDALKDSGQLEALAGSFARLDPPMAGTRRSVGPLLLVEHFLRELAVKDTVDGALPRSARSVLSVGEVVCALVASRLCSPSPLYDVAGWASGAAVHELLGIPPALLNDDRLGRALETFAVYAERSPLAGRGGRDRAVRCERGPAARRSDDGRGSRRAMSTRRWSRRGGRLTVGSPARSARCRRQRRMGRCSTAARIRGTRRS